MGTGDNGLDFKKLFGDGSGDFKDDTGSRPIEEGEIKDLRSTKEKTEALRDRRAATDMSDEEIVVVDEVGQPINQETDELILDANLPDTKTSQENLDRYEQAHQLMQGDKTEPLSIKRQKELDALHDELLLGIVNELSEKENVQQLLVRQAIATGGDKDPLTAGIAVTMEKLLTQPDLRRQFSQTVKLQPDANAAIATLKRVVESYINQTETGVKKQPGKKQEAGLEVRPDTQQTATSTWGELAARYGQNRDAVSMADKTRLVREVIGGIAVESVTSIALLREGQSADSKNMADMMSLGGDRLAAKLIAEHGLAAQIDAQLKNAQTAETAIEIIENTVRKKLELLNKGATGLEAMHAATKDSGVPTWKKPDFNEARIAAKTRRAEIERQRTASPIKTTKSETGPIKKLWSRVKGWFGG
ncbi:MAG: hypothetical protein V1738_00580 [Patescibacteria group bacterium]